MLLLFDSVLSSMLQLVHVQVWLFILKMMIMDDGYDELQCGICLELFKDPRSLPCLHTFCVECIQRTLNDKHSLKCPVCRAEHLLGEEGAKLLPVNAYACQELTRKRLRQQLEKDAKKCECCGEDECADVALCSECGIICKSCLANHKKMACLKDHEVIQTEDQESLLQPPTKKINKCLRHSGQELKYLCTDCTEMVCPECLLLTHKDHVYCTAEEARTVLETRMKEFAGLVATKKDEFDDHLAKLNEFEGKAVESIDCAKVTVNNVFDAIVASVEAQRTEALQKVSESLKKIWSQKELMEVSLAQLDSFTRSVDRTQKCTASSSYIAMAAQGIKLMERLKETHGDKDTLRHQLGAVVGSKYKAGHPLVIPLDSAVEVGQLSLEFMPKPNHVFGFDSCGTKKVTIEVFLEVEDFPVIFPTCDKIQLNCEMLFKGKPVTPEIVVQSSSWKIEAKVDFYADWNSSEKLVVQCRLSGLVFASEKITYRIARSILYR